jgi:hypothetical protein
MALESLYHMASSGEITDLPDLFFQPEVLLIYERLTNAQNATRAAWTGIYPPKETGEDCKHFWHFI